MLVAMGSILKAGAGRGMLVVVVLAALFAVALSGCGSDDDGGEATSAAEVTATTGETGASVEAEGKASDEEQPEDSGDSSKGSGKESSGKEGSAAGEEGSDAGGGAGEQPKFAIPPNRHKDSGGGSKQFRRPGYDNSIQDSGKEADDKTFADVAATVHAFLDAQAAGNREEACKYVSSALINEMLQLTEGAPDIPKDCAGILDALLAKPANAKMRRAISTADIGSVRIDGNRGFVIYRGVEKKGMYVMPIVFENGRWRIAAIAGSYIP